LISKFKASIKIKGFWDVMLYTLVHRCKGSEETCYWNGNAVGRVTEIEVM
jgi:hypothetical protein